MHLRTAYLPEIGQPLSCRFDAGAGGSVIAAGEVIWKQDAGKGGEFGIRFTDLDPQSAEALQRDHRNRVRASAAPAKGNRVRLHIEGLGSPMRAHVKESRRGRADRVQRPRLPPGRQAPRARGRRDRSEAPCEGRACRVRDRPRVARAAARDVVPVRGPAGHRSRRAPRRTPRSRWSPTTSRSAARAGGRGARLARSSEMRGLRREERREGDPRARAPLRSRQDDRCPARGEAPRRHGRRHRDPASSPHVAAARREGCTRADGRSSATRCRTRRRSPRVSPAKTMDRQADRHRAPVSPSWRSSARSRSTSRARPPRLPATTTRRARPAAPLAPTTAEAPLAAPPSVLSPVTSTPRAAPEHPDATTSGATEVGDERRARRGDRDSRGHHRTRVAPFSNGAVSHGNVLRIKMDGDDREDRRGRSARPGSPSSSRGADRSSRRRRSPRATGVSLRSA